MDRAREQIRPIAEEFGKEKTADACEVLVEIVPGKEPVARLKSHIRRMAFQILGPEPATTGPVPVDPAPATPGVAANDSPPAKPPCRREFKKPTDPKPKVDVSGSRQGSDTPLMEQYRAAKEKHPDMILLFSNVAK